ncbi:hypothetical protein [Rhodococcus globerulus]|uniref:hypothetical protein n=1 Tax=Rhodococcus globerulus TaxID=33008 RepID=UPI001F32C172|nr:hypothetical protein [Rhodococcus globerulus]MCE4267299.1 hypothetical protein [Rhodococcus globerulus]
MERDVARITNLLSAIQQVELSLEEPKDAADLYVAGPTPSRSAFLELTRAQLVLVALEVPLIE